MSIDNQHEHDDAEFALFLQGQDALSRQLKALPQVESPPELDAAILARIGAALAQEQATPVTDDPAANDPAVSDVTGPGDTGTRPVASYLRSGWKPLWRVAAGIAAGVLVTVLFPMFWRSAPDLSAPTTAQAIKGDETSAQVVAQPPPPALAALEEHKIAAPRDIAVPPPAMSPAPALPEVAPPPPSAAAAPRPTAAAEQQVTVSGIRPAPSQKMESASPVQVITAAEIARTAEQPKTDTAQRATSKVDVSGSSGMELAWTRDPGQPAQRAQRPAAKSVAAPAPVAAAPAPAPAPVAAYSADAPRVTDARSINAADVSADRAQREQRQRQQASTWLDLIEQKLKLRANDVAIAEWKAFRKAYPDYPVPDDLRARIEAAQAAALDGR